MVQRRWVLKAFLFEDVEYAASEHVHSQCYFPHGPRTIWRKKIPLAITHFYRFRFFFSTIHSFLPFSPSPSPHSLTLFLSLPLSQRCWICPTQISILCDKCANIYTYFNGYKKSNFDFLYPPKCLKQHIYILLVTNLISVSSLLLMQYA